MELEELFIKPKENNNGSTNVVKELKSWGYDYYIA